MEGLAEGSNKTKEKKMKRSRLKRKRQQGVRHRLIDMEHNFFKAVHNSGMSAEEYLDKKWNKLSLKQQHEILLGGTIGAAAGATLATVSIGSLPFAGSILAFGYTGAKGIQFSIGEISEKYHHWKKAHKV